MKRRLLDWLAVRAFRLGGWLTKRAHPEWPGCMVQVQVLAPYQASEADKLRAAHLHLRPFNAEAPRC